MISVRILIYTWLSVVGLAFTNFGTASCLRCNFALIPLTQPISSLKTSSRRADMSFRVIVSVISEADYVKYFKGEKLEKSLLVLKMYSGKKLHSLGVM
jgi:hypothetical protein